MLSQRRLIDSAMCGRWLTVAATDFVVSCVSVVVVVAVFVTLSSAESVSVNGETRCYCNEAACVSTGYMCKSAKLGACFSQLSREGASVRSTHGCVESLPEIDYSACVQLEDAASNSHVTSGATDGRPILICCRADMCNYMDSVGINGFFTRRDAEMAAAATSNGSGRPQDPKSELRSNSTERRLDIQKENEDIDDDSSAWSQLATSSDGDLWLRVAIITVPVVGLFLLIPLVVIAVRLLTSDRRSVSGSQNQLRHWLLAGQMTSAVPGNSAPTVSDRTCSVCRSPSIGWCDCDNRKCYVVCDDGEHKISCNSFLELPPPPSPLHHHFVMAAIHNGTSGRRGYEQIRTHVVRTTTNSSQCNHHSAVNANINRHSIGNSIGCCSEHPDVDRTLAFTV